MRRRKKRKRRRTRLWFDSQTKRLPSGKPDTRERGGATRKPGHANERTLPIFFFFLSQMTGYADNRLEQFPQRTVLNLEMRFMNKVGRKNTEYVKFFPQVYSVIRGSAALGFKCNPAIKLIYELSH